MRWRRLGGSGTGGKSFLILAESLRSRLGVVGEWTVTSTTECSQRRTRDRRGGVMSYTFEFEEEGMDAGRTGTAGNNVAALSMAFDPANAEKEEAAVAFDAAARRWSATSLLLSVSTSERYDRARVSLPPTLVLEKSFPSDCDRS
jgi:hypothetical protein